MFSPVLFPTENPFPVFQTSVCPCAIVWGQRWAPVTRLSLSPLPLRGSVSLRPVAGTAKDEGLLRPPPEIVDAVETAVVVLPDVAPLVTRGCGRKETCLLALTAVKESRQGAMSLLHLRVRQVILGMSQLPFPRQRIVGGCRWMNPF